MKTYNELCNEPCDFPDVCFRMSGSAYYICKKHHPLNEDGSWK